VQAALESVQREASPAGQLCMTIARQIEAGAESSTGLAALSRELSARLAEATANVQEQTDLIDELRARRARRNAI